MVAVRSTAGVMSLQLSCSNMSMTMDELLGRGEHTRMNDMHIFAPGMNVFIHDAANVHLMKQDNGTRGTIPDSQTLATAAKMLGNVDAAVERAEREAHLRGRGVLLFPFEEELPWMTGKGIAIYALLDDKGRVVYNGQTENWPRRKDKHNSDAGLLEDGTIRGPVDKGMEVVKWLHKSGERLTSEDRRVVFLAVCYHPCQKTSTISTSSSAHRTSARLRSKLNGKRGGQS
jgi:hypothetical protein